jgi:DNA-directed RNA polymerase subunit RPC12/RpoP
LREKTTTVYARPVPETTRSLLQPDGSMRCPRCGSTQFHAQRSAGRKVAFGFASLLASTNQLRCMGCGQKYTIDRSATAPTPPATPQPAVGVWGIWLGSHGGRKVDTIKAIRSVMPGGLVQTKSIVDAAPTRLARYPTEREASMMLGSLRAACPWAAFELIPPANPLPEPPS